MIISYPFDDENCKLIVTDSVGNVLKFGPAIYILDPTKTYSINATINLDNINVNIDLIIDKGKFNFPDKKTEENFKYWLQPSDEDLIDAVLEDNIINDYEHVVILKNVDKYVLRPSLGDIACTIIDIAKLIYLVYDGRVCLVMDAYTCDGSGVRIWRNDFVEIGYTKVANDKMFYVADYMDTKSFSNQIIENLTSVGMLYYG